MADDIVLSPEVRGSLLALQQINRLIERSATRISSGQRVTGLENPAAFYDAQSLSFRASNLLGLKDNVNLAVSKLEVAEIAIAAVDSLLDQLKSLAEQAKDESDEDAADTAAEFDDLRDQIDSLVNDASLNGINLLRASPDTLTVIFNESGSSSLDVVGIASDVDSLAILSGVDGYNAFLDDTDSDNAIAAIEAAQTTIEQTASTLGSYSAIISTRATFLDDIVTTLQGGAAKLVATNLETEGANLLSLQTQRELAVSTLGILDPAASGILDLF